MIAVIISVYKNDKLCYLNQALESLYNQTYKNFHIYLQIDGEVNSQIENFLDNEFKNSKLYFLGKRKENRGLAYSLNELLNLILVRGYDYIARMDADDISLPNRLFEQYNFMEKNKECDVVGSNILEFYDDGTKKIIVYDTYNEKIKKNLATKTAIPHVSAFFRSSFFKKSSLYNIHSVQNEDLYLWLSGFLNECVFSSIPMVLVKVRMSRDLFKRRGNLKSNWNTYKLRNKIIYLLKFNKIFYFINIILFLTKMSPQYILSIIYKFR